MPKNHTPKPSQHQRLLAVLIDNWPDLVPSHVLNRPPGGGAILQYNRVISDLKDNGLVICHEYHKPYHYQRLITRPSQIDKNKCCSKQKAVAA